MQRYILPMIVGGLLLPLGLLPCGAIAADRPELMARSSIRDFEQLQFSSNDLRFAKNHQEAQVSLTIQNRSPRSRNLSLQEIIAIEKIVLVDTQEHTYSLKEVAGNLSQQISNNGTLTLLLKFKTPTGMRPSYLFIERTQGESITIQL